MYVGQLVLNHDSPLTKTKRTDQPTDPRTVHRPAARARRRDQRGHRHAPRHLLPGAARGRAGKAGGRVPGACPNLDWIGHVMSALCHWRADPITDVRQCLQPRLEELLPVYESLKRVIDAAKAEREACEAFQRREGVIE